MRCLLPAQGSYGADSTRSRGDVYGGDFTEGLSIRLEESRRIGGDGQLANVGPYMYPFDPTEIPAQSCMPQDRR
jgi:hypothetical protein